MKLEKMEDIAVIRYNSGRHHTGKSVQYFCYCRTKRSENLRFFRREGFDEYLNICAVFIKKY